MKPDLILGRLGLAAIVAIVATAFAGSPALAQSALGTSVPDAASVKDGLFPEEACKELEASGFKCMGLKPAIKYSLPASSFKVGSAELPAALDERTAGSSRPFSLPRPAAQGICSVAWPA